MEVVQLITGWVGLFAYVSSCFGTLAVMKEARGKTKNENDNISNALALFWPLSIIGLLVITGINYVYEK